MLSYKLQIKNKCSLKFYSLFLTHPLFLALAVFALVEQI